MNKFRQLLDDLQKGKQDLSAVEEWIRTQLAEDKVDEDTLLKTLLAMTDLDAATVRGLVNHIESLGKRKKSKKEGYSAADISHLELAPMDGEKAKKEVDEEIAEAKTEFQHGDDNSLEKTIAGRTKKPPGGGDHSEDETVIADDVTNRHGGGDSESQTHPSSNTGTTGPSWPGKGSTGQTQIGPGTVLKERFELITAIGEGGMGTVYKARDLLKVEAKDRNPYIAVKLLSGDFKEHPEAFISLQRETSKAQKLAHPNVATVYDFDRDGATVFMTMELLEGQELAKFIRKLPPGGLPANEALDIIKQLCDGLGYAHGSGLVHSDLKPGNAYLTRDKSLKLLDFGIARASKTRADASGEITLFDPSQLGALTPAYATLEMFDGAEPDPRDDVYALACISYELLSGKHPFNKLSAVKVKEKGLTPAIIPKLTKRQNRALRDALSVERENRTASVEAFWEDLRPRKDYTWYYVGGGVAAILLLGLIGYTLVIPWLERQQYLDTIAEVNQQGSDAIPRLLESLDKYDAAARSLILEGIKDSAIAYYEKHAEDLVDPAQQSWRYPQALALIDTLDTFYPDSAQVNTIQQNLTARRDLLIAEQSELFNQYLQQQRIMPLANEADITDVVAILSQADPANPLLADARLISQYATQARAMVAGDKYNQAADILKTALAYAPRDPALANLNDTVQRELERRAEAAEVTQIKQRLADAKGNLATARDYIAIQDDILQLALLRPDDPLLAKLQEQARTALDKALSQAIAEKQWQQAQNLLFTMAPLLPMEFILEKRETLSRAQLNSGYLPTSVSERNARIKTQRDVVEALLSKAEFTDAWHGALAAEFRKLLALLQPNRSWLAPLREDIATSYIGHANTLRESGRYTAAFVALEHANEYAPKFAAIADARKTIEADKVAYEKAEAQRLQEARRTALKNQLRVQAQAGAIQDAEASLAELRKLLPADDRFITETAPQLLADAYLKLANAQAADKNYNNARTFVRRGLSYMPEHKELQNAFEEFNHQAERAGLLNAAQNATPLTIGGLPEKLRSTQQQFPDGAATLESELINTLVARINDLKDYDLVMANSLLDKAQGVFPNKQTLQNIDLPRPPTPSKYVPKGRVTLQAGNLSAAEALLETAQREEPDNPQVSVFANEVQAAQAQANKYYLAYQQFMQAGNRSQARVYLEAAMQQWKDSELFQTTYKNQFATTRAPERAADGSRPCSPVLAGYGASGRAECYDMVAGEPGPTMVVVPAGGDHEQPYAISKYEISIEKYNHFCQQAGCAQLSGEPGLPATGLSVEQAKAYAAWLSENTGHQYQLPTAEAWLHAANAGGKSRSSNFNCRVTQGGQILKGLSMLNIRTGEENAWGLVNYVGNAQEWVRADNGLQARGGYYQDNLSICSTTLTRPHNGKADPFTGFRLVRGVSE